MTDSRTLLADYVQTESDAAFRELVARYVDLVYSTALRLVDGDQHRAEDVAQTVFVDLARTARTFSGGVQLGGWLHRHTCFVAAKTMRGERRRQRRERQAVEMNALQDNSGEHFALVAPVLDEAINELGDADRTAILLRFYEQQDFRSVGTAIGSTEDAARMRVARALEKLQELLMNRGVTTSGTALSVALAANAVQAAPVGLAIGICKAALAGVGTSGVLKLMATTKLKISVVTAVVVTGVIIALFHRRETTTPTGQDGSAGTLTSDVLTGAVATLPTANSTRGDFLPSAQKAPTVASAQQIVSGKLSQFARSRRDLAHALARRHGVAVSDDVERFFEAVSSGNWDEIVVRFKMINGGDFSAGHAAGRPPGVEYLWPAIIDAYGAAEQAHLWPAQKLLDYGDAILSSLHPGMVYVGGTDSGRWIPSLLNETSEGERHIVITQNGLADGTYLEYLSELYGGQMATLTASESKRVFDEYLADAKKRLEHDQQFPDEPKQIQPDEQISMANGQVQISGRDAVFGVNEKLLLALMEKNPDLAFALQESQPLRGTYADAVPLGPLMELRAQDAQNAFTPDQAAQTVDYWRTAAQRLLADPEALDSAPTLKTYSHDVNAAANLLAAHNFNTEAEEAYRLASQLLPSNIEAAIGRWHLLVRSGRTEEAERIWADFESRFPARRAELERARASGSITVQTSPGR